MTTEAVLGLDAGTTSTKAVVMASDGVVLAVGRSDPIATLSPEPGAAEQEPAQLARAMSEATGRALSGLPSGVNLAAVAMAAQSGSVIPIGDDERPVGNLLTWMDARAAPIVDGWTGAERELIRSISGWSPSTGLGLASISGIRSTRPDRFAAADRWASVDDHLLHTLAGVWRTNPSNASGMQLMDIATLEWDGRLCELAGVRAEQLAPIHRTGEIIGEVTSAAARWIALESDIPVVVGGHDQACAALGLRATTPGVVVLSAGTAWVLTVVTDRVAIDQLPLALNLSPHVVDDVWSASENLGGLGAMVDWWRRQAHGPDPEPGMIDADLAVANPDGPLFVPELMTRAENGPGRFVAEDRHDGVAERTRAVIEAAAFEVRRALEPIARSVTRPRSLILVGGGARSRRLRQLLADVTRLPIEAPGDESWPALGAATIAATSLGWSLPDPVSEPADVVEPAPDAADAHDERFETYLRLVEGGST